MLKTPIILLALFGATACTHGGHEETAFDDGHPAYENTCNGTTRGFQGCIDEASQTCSGQYKVLSSDETTLVANSGSAGARQGYQGEVTNRSMVYRCDNVAH
jgi:hypothetical protein